jgi:hypothetical protein
MIFQPVFPTASLIANLQIHDNCPTCPFYFDRQGKPQAHRNRNKSLSDFISLKWCRDLINVRRFQKGNNILFSDENNGLIVI